MVYGRLTNSARMWLVRVEALTTDEKIIATAVSAIFAHPRLVPRTEIRRIEERPLRLDDGAIDTPGPEADFAAVLQGFGDPLQKGIAQLRRNRPSGLHHGIEFGIG